MQLLHPPPTPLILLPTLLALFLLPIPSPPARAAHLKDLDRFLPPFVTPASLDSLVAGVWDSFKTLLDAKHGDARDAVVDLKKYLAHFGYMHLDPSQTNVTSLFDDATEAAVKLYQESFGLPVTGDLDARTLVFLMRPRCGREDVVNGIPLMLQSYGDNPSPAYPGHTVSHFGQAVARYTYFPGKHIWSAARRNLTYAFSPTMETTRVPLKQRRQIFTDAFSEWAAVVPINFTEIADFDEADIKIEFASFEHGDKEPFDGVLGILGHAFSPQDGRFHLDNSEYWWATDMAVDGTEQPSVDLQSVVTHEIGHLIGLGHSPVSEAIMYPSISPREVKLKLQKDDIAGAQSLYGKNPSYDPDSPLPWVLTGVQDVSGAKARRQLLWRISSPFSSSSSSSSFFIFMIIIRVMETNVPFPFFFFFFFLLIRALGMTILLPFFLLHSFQAIYE